LHTFSCQIADMNIARNLFFFLLLSCFIPFMISCDKNKDETKPQVSVTSPAGPEEFALGDSIPVSAMITHNKPITSVKVSLLNQDGITALTPVYLFPGTTSYELDLMYPVNKNLESGAFSLLVSAGDGLSTTNVYTQVQITGGGRFFERVLAICEPNTLKTLLYAIDGNGDHENIMSLEYGYVDSDISSDLRQLYMLRPAPDRLFAFNLDDLTQDYMVEASPPHPQFHSVYFSKFPSVAYVPNANGEIRGYDQLGSSAYVTPVNLDTIPMLCRKHDQMILTYCERRGGPERFIRQYYAATGVFRTDLKINFTIVEMFSLDPDVALVLGNDNSTGKAYQLDVSGNVLYSEIQLPEGQLSHAVQVSEEVFLIGHDKGIYKYDHDIFSLSLWLANAEMDALAFDDLRQIIYFADGKKVYAYRYSDASLLQEIDLPYRVLNLLIQYNK